MNFKTELEALIACRNHWQFMEITWSRGKKDYAPSHEWENSCACCDFVTGTINLPIEMSCSEVCPLSTFAWGITCIAYEEFSFYREWYDAENPQQRQFWANRMVYACNLAIEDCLLKETIK